MHVQREPPLRQVQLSKLPSQWGLIFPRLCVTIDSLPFDSHYFKPLFLYCRLHPFYYINADFQLVSQVLVSTREHCDRLITARLCFDVLGTETIIVARTDAEGAALLDCNIDPRDHAFILGSTN